MEITIAMGILAFVLLSIIGLLGVGLNSGRSAQIETAKVAAARFVLTSVQTNDPSALSGSNLWFNYDGMTKAGSSGAYFQCVLRTNSPVASLPGLIGLRMEFSYPLTAPATARTTNTFYASIVRKN